MAGEHRRFHSACPSSNYSHLTPLPTTNTQQHNALLGPVPGGVRGSGSRFVREGGVCLLRGDVMACFCTGEVRARCVQGTEDGCGSNRSWHVTGRAQQSNACKPSRRQPRRRPHTPPTTRTHNFTLPPDQSPARVQPKGLTWLPSPSAA